MIISEVKKHFNEDVEISGFVDEVRNLKWVQFVVLRDHTGKVHDFDFFAKDEILTSSIDPGEPYIYNEADDTSSANGIKNYNHNTYGIMYKMFSLSSDFAVNGNRILNIELANGVRIDGAGAYGSVIEVE